MEPAHLTDRAVIAVTGPEARDFLQGLITNDIGNLHQGTALYSALLSPQGKILFDFFITEGEGALLLDCAAAAQEALFKKLRLYKLRAKVELEMRSQLGVYGGLRAEAAARAITFADPRHAALPARSIGALADMPKALAGPEAYHAARLALGVPEGADFGYEKIFALDGGLDELHAVSFEKGCYVGQELTARMKHRATARKRPYLIAADAALPTPGTPVVAHELEAGEIMTAHGKTGLALVRLDRIDGPQAFTAGNIPVALTRPPWLG
jgi:folate-binding protein YgfZ